MRRASLDLRILRSRLDERDHVAAGIPWFATLFGRVGRRHRRGRLRRQRDASRRSGASKRCVVTAAGGARTVGSEDEVIWRVAADLW
jgi:hypothetical protein